MCVLAVSQPDGVCLFYLTATSRKVAQTINHSDSFGRYNINHSLWLCYLLRFGKTEYGKHMYSHTDTVYSIQLYGSLKCNPFMKKASSCQLTVQQSFVVQTSTTYSSLFKIRYRIPLQLDSWCLNIACIGSRNSVKFYSNISDFHNHSLELGTRTNITCIESL